MCEGADRDVVVALIAIAISVLVFVAIMLASTHVRFLRSIEDAVAPEKEVDDSGISKQNQQAE